MESNIFDKTLTRVESKLLGGPTWATDSMTARERLRFYRDTGQWPGLHSKPSTQMFIEADIRSAEEIGQPECAEIKRCRAREAGLIE